MTTKYAAATVKNLEPETFVIVGLDFTNGRMGYLSDGMDQMRFRTCQNPGCVTLRSICRSAAHVPPGSDSVPASS